MPVHTSAHAHAHARPAYACPPRTSAPKPLLAHPRCAIHVTCDMACSTMPSPTHGALRNCTAFHNPSARLQPRRMGAGLMHSKWEDCPLPSQVCRMCLCGFPSFASPPLLVCVCLCACVRAYISHMHASRATTSSKHSQYFCPTASRVAAALPVNRCQKLVRPGD